VAVRFGAIVGFDAGTEGGEELRDAMLCTPEDHRIPVKKWTSDATVGPMI